MGLNAIQEQNIVTVIAYFDAIGVDGAVGQLDRHGNAACQAFFMNDHMGFVHARGKAAGGVDDHIGIEIERLAVGIVEALVGLEGDLLAARTAGGASSAIRASGPAISGR